MEDEEQPSSVASVARSATTESLEGGEGAGSIHNEDLNEQDEEDDDELHWMDGPTSKLDQWAGAVDCFRIGKGWTDDGSDAGVGRGACWLRVGSRDMPPTGARLASIAAMDTSAVPAAVVTAASGDRIISEERERCEGHGMDDARGCIILRRRQWRRGRLRSCMSGCDDMLIAQAPLEALQSVEAFEERFGRSGVLVLKFFAAAVGVGDGHIDNATAPRSLVLSVAERGARSALQIWLESVALRNGLLREFFVARVQTPQGAPPLSYC